MLPTSWGLASLDGGCCVWGGGDLSLLRLWGGLSPPVSRDLGIVSFILPGVS